MKNLIQISFLTLTLAMVAFQTGFGQKYGYINSGNLLEKMPDRAAADEQLEAFQNPLLEDGKAKVKALETKVEQLYREIEEGKLSQVQIQDRQTALQQEQEVIAKYEQEVQEKILKKREELLQPILNRVQSAIEEVAKENSYTMIFDASLFNVLLYAKDSDDLTARVEQKLGI
ncbi:MAG: OmpH family outer membrane protein [Bacteroidota bacterium]